MIILHAYLTKTLCSESVSPPFESVLVILHADLIKTFESVVILLTDLTKKLESVVVILHADLTKTFESVVVI